MEGLWFPLCILQFLKFSALRQKFSQKSPSPAIGAVCDAPSRRCCRSFFRAFWPVFARWPCCSAKRRSTGNCCANRWAFAPRVHRMPRRSVARFRRVPWPTSPRRSANGRNRFIVERTNELGSLLIHLQELTSQVPGLRLITGDAMMGQRPLTQSFWQGRPRTRK